MEKKNGSIFLCVLNLHLRLQPNQITIFTSCKRYNAYEWVCIGYVSREEKKNRARDKICEM